MVRRLSTVGLSLACLAFAGPVPQLASRTLDLRKWGYTADPLIASYGEFYPPSHLLSIYQNGNIATGLIRRGDGLATRDHPSLSLQTVVVDRQGKFLWQSTFPTTMWKDNGIWAVGSSNLLIRTPEALTLWSREEGALAAREPIDPHTWVQVSPNGQRLLLRLPGRDVQLIQTSALTALKSCPYAEQRITSIVDDVVLRFLRSQPPFAVRVEEFCGPARFDSSWTGPDVRDATLLDETRFVIRSQHGIEVVDRDKRVWSDSFAKNEAVQDVESDEKGVTIAVAVARYVGGSQFLDMSGHLKVMRIVVYRAADGKRAAELVVEHPPRLPFNFLALSPDGSVLAILSDGFLQVAQLNQ